MDEEKNNQEIREIKDEVLASIKRGTVTMKPRWHFILQAVLFVLGAVIVFLALVYLVSFIVFSLRQTGAWFAPEFALRGWFTFFRSMPWILVLLVLLFAAILEVLVRQYSFTYRKPLLYSILAILVAVAAAGVMSEPLQRPLYRSARQNHLPFAGPFYRDFGERHFDDVHRGSVEELTATGFILEDSMGVTSSIMIGSSTMFPAGAGFEVGDMVVVFGDRHGVRVQAEGVRTLINE